MSNLASFFSPESGQRRTAWLGRQTDAIADGINYYLGPTGVPERANALINLFGAVSPGADVRDAAQASGDLMDFRGPLDTAGDAATLSAALGSLLIPGSLSSARDGVSEAASRLARSYDPSITRMFFGPRARTADTPALRRAQSLAESGADRQSIWDQTGWFQGADGQWRFEADDTAFREVMQKPTVGGSFRHESLFDAYPDVADIEYAREPLPRGVNAALQTGDEVSGVPDRVVVSQSQQGGRGLSSVLHELQHAVQNREGFAAGTNTSSLKPGSPAWDIYQKIRGDMGRPMPFDEYVRSAGFEDMPPDEALSPAEIQSAYQEYVQQVKDSLFDRNLDVEAQRTAVREAYRRSAGEVEARNVQTRMNLTPEQRRAQPPWTTEDLPTDEQIVQYLRAK